MSESTNVPTNWLVINQRDRIVMEDGKEVKDISWEGAPKEAATWPTGARILFLLLTVLPPIGMLVINLRRRRRGRL